VRKADFDTRQRSSHVQARGVGKRRGGGVNVYGSALLFNYPGGLVFSFAVFSLSFVFRVGTGTLLAFILLLAFRR